VETALLFGNERANNRRHQIADEEKKNVKKIGAKGAISAIIVRDHVYRMKPEGVVVLSQLYRQLLSLQRVGREESLMKKKM
jgi:hypothetical protein